MLPADSQKDLTAPTASLPAGPIAAPLLLITVQIPWETTATTAIDAASSAKRTNEKRTAAR